jgi:transcription antitermination factor NusG
MPDSGAAAEDPNKWHVAGIVVTVKSTGKTGTIKSVGDSDCQVQLTGGDETTVAKDDLKFVTPEKRDRVVILAGEFKGQVGNLASITGSDGIVKLENYEITVVDMKSLAKAAAV